MGIPRAGREEDKEDPEGLCPGLAAASLHFRWTQEIWQNPEALPSQGAEGGARALPHLPQRVEWKVNGLPPPPLLELPDPPIPGLWISATPLDSSLGFLSFAWGSRGHFRTQRSKPKPFRLSPFPGQTRIQ